MHTAKDTSVPPRPCIRGLCLRVLGWHLRVLLGFPASASVSWLLPHTSASIVLRDHDPGSYLAPTTMLPLLHLFASLPLLRRAAHLPTAATPLVSSRSSCPRDGTLDKFKLQARSLTGLDVAPRVHNGTSPAATVSMPLSLAYSSPTRQAVCCGSSPVSHASA